MLGKLLILVREEFIADADNVLFGRQEGTTAGILARFIEFQPQLSREVQLVIDEVAHLHISLEHHLQPLSRWGDENKQNSCLVLVGQFCIDVVPNLTDITIQMVVVSYHQPVQVYVRLITPATLQCPFLTGFLVLHHLFRLVECSDEYDQRQLLLFLVVGRLVALRQCRTSFSNQLGSVWRPDERPELLQTCYLRR